MKVVSDIGLIKNFKKSTCMITRTYKFGKRTFKIAQIELFGEEDEYIRFAVDIEIDEKTSQINIVSNFISVATGKELPRLVTIDDKDLILGLMKDIQEDTNDTQIETN